MKKTIILFLYIFSFLIYSKELNILDDNNILNVKSVEYYSEEELNQKLKQLLENIYQKGYIGSHFIQEGENLRLQPLVIQKVIYEDKSTKFLNFKKNILGLDLENRIFNILEIEKIVEKFNKNSSNDVKIDIFPKENDKVEVKLSNKYTPRSNISLTTVSSLLKENSHHTYLLGIEAEQILGLNDKLKLNFTALENNVNLGLKHSFDFFSKEIDNEFKYTYTKDSKEVENKYIDYTLKLKNNIKDNLSLENSFTLAVKKQQLRDVKIVNLKYLEIENNLKYSKKYKNTLFGISQTISNNVVLYDNKFDDMIFSFENNIYANNMYFDIEMESKFSKSYFNEKFVFDRYLYSNSLGINSFPIEMAESNWQVMLNAKLKYPVIIKDNIIQGYTEIALGTSEKTKFNIGASIGLEYVYKNFGANLKYSMDKLGNKNLGLKLNYVINIR